MCHLKVIPIQFLEPEIDPKNSKFHELISRTLPLLVRETHTHTQVRTCTSTHKRTMTKRSVDPCSCLLDIRPASTHTHTKQAMTKRQVEVCSCFSATRTHTQAHTCAHARLHARVLTLIRDPHTHTHTYTLTHTHTHHAHTKTRAYAHLY